MADLAISDIVSSNLGIMVYADTEIKLTSTAAELPATAKKLNDVLKITGLGIERETKDYVPLDGNGVPKKALLAQKQPDLGVDCVRTETGAYVDGSTFHYFGDKAEEFKQKDAWFNILVVKPVGAGYEADLYLVAVNKFGYDADPGIGQEYNVGLCRSGRKVKVAVTEDVDGKLTFALKS